VIRERSAKVPVINLSLFRDPAFVSGTLIGGLMFAMLMGSMFLLPVFMQELMGYSATQSGIALMPRTLVMMVAVPLVGRLYGKVHPGFLIAFGVLCFSFGSFLFSHITLASSTTDIIWALAATGVGFGFLFVPLSTAALANVPRENMSDATGLNSLFRQIGGSIGLAIFANLESDYAKQAHNALLADVTSSRPAAVERLAAMTAGFMGRGMDANGAHAAAIASLHYGVLRQATVLAFEKTFLLQGIAFLAVLPLLFFLRVGPVTQEPAAVHLE
jgi:DHA2 family multidrug resistance protein